MSAHSGSRALESELKVKQLHPTILPYSPCQAKWQLDHSMQAKDLASLAYS
jgi:hypothetical protein